MSETYDKIDMKIMPAGTYKLSWRDSDRCIILLNGKELLDYVRDAEIAIFKKYGLKKSNAGDYHYLSPSELYGYLSDPANSFEEKDVPIMCCSCDEVGCASVRINIIKSQESIIWKNFRSVRDEWNLDYAFKFDTKTYNTFLEKIKNAPDNWKK